MRAAIGPEKALRRAGGRWAVRIAAPEPGTPPWRIKVDEWEGREPGSGERHGMYGVAHNLLSHPREGRLPDSPDPVNEEWDRHYVFPATELDEVVVGRWCHLEQMDTGRWWANMAGVTLWIEADRDGRPTSASVFGPHDYDQPAPGCSYTVDWHDEGLVSQRSYDWMRDTVAELVRTRGEDGKTAEAAWRRAEIALLRPAEEEARDA